MVNAPGTVFVERAGPMTALDAPAADRRGGGRGPRSRSRRPLGEDPATEAIIDARLADGSRVAVCSPLAAAAITVHRFGVRAFTIDELTASGSLPAPVVDETAAVLGGRRNVLISGGTGSGKTTLLNALVSLLPAEGRVISIEDTLELRLRRANGLRFEARGLAGRGVTIRNWCGTRCATGPSTSSLAKCTAPRRPACSKGRAGKRPQGRQEVRAVESPDAAGPSRDGTPRHLGVRPVPRTRDQARDALQVTLDRRESCASRARGSSPLEAADS